MQTPFKPDTAKVEASAATYRESLAKGHLPLLVKAMQGAWGPDRDYKSILIAEMEKDEGLRNRISDPRTSAVEIAESLFEHFDHQFAKTGGAALR
jgi:hypothetical protein